MKAAGGGAVPAGHCVGFCQNVTPPLLDQAPHKHQVPFHNAQAPRGGGLGSYITKGVLAPGGVTLSANVTQRLLEGGILVWNTVLPTKLLPGMNLKFGVGIMFAVQTEIILGFMSLESVVRFLRMDDTVFQNVRKNF